MKHFQTNRRSFLRTLGSSAVAFPFFLNAGILSGCVKRSFRPAAMVRHHTYLLENGSVFLNGSFEKMDLVIENGIIAKIGKEKDGPGVADVKVIDCSRFFHIAGLGRLSLPPGRHRGRSRSFGTRNGHHGDGGSGNIWPRDI